MIKFPINKLGEVSKFILIWFVIIFLVVNNIISTIDVFVPKIFIGI